jgi:hypothetical protein
VDFSFIGKIQVALVLFGGIPRDKETQALAAALSLGGEEGLKDLVPKRRLYAGSVISVLHEIVGIADFDLDLGLVGGVVLTA